MINSGSPAAPDDEDLLLRLAALSKAERELLASSGAASFTDIAERFSRLWGETLRSQRVASGLSQEELAGRLRAFGLDLHQTTIAKIEKGTRPLRMTEFVMFGLAMDVPWLALLVAPGNAADFMKMPTPEILQAMQLSVEIAERDKERVLKSMQEYLKSAARTYADRDAESVALSAALRRAGIEVNSSGTSANPDK